MDRSLWLLLRLRIFAALRRFERSLRSLKGALLTIVGALLFAPMILSMILAPKIQTGLQHEAIRRYGPLAFLAYCMLNLLLSSGDRAIYYSPAEVSFLFTGPYRPRQLLLYKIVAGLGAALLTSFFLTFAFAHHASRWATAYIALFLALAFLYLFSLSIGLVISIIGALAFTRARQGILLLVGLAIVLPALPLVNRAATMPIWELVQSLVDSPSVALIVVPFRPFVYAFAADRVWPDLVGWSAVSLAIDAALLAAVLATNARFMETSAAASARIYAQIQQIRRRGGVGAKKARFGLPMLPWLGGAGPNLWRQLTTASRSPAHLAAIGLLFVAPVGVMVLFGKQGPGEPGMAILGLSMMAGMAIFAPTMVGFDFRSDIARMEDLKTLPIPPTRLVLGQLLAPVLILCSGECIAMAVVGFKSPEEWTLLLGAAALTLPINLLLVAIENLYCLWFPFRMIGINSIDFQAMGRQLLVMMAKLTTLGVVGGLAAGLGFAVYTFGGQNLGVAMIAVWFVTALAALGLVPLVALAFEQFDVAQTMPE